MQSSGRVKMKDCFLKNLFMMAKMAASDVIWTQTIRSAGLCLLVLYPLKYRVSEKYRLEAMKTTLRSWEPEGGVASGGGS